MSSRTAIFKPPDAERWREPQFAVEFGNASEQILNVAKERNADLIVLGAKFAGQRGAATHLASATAHTVVCSTGYYADRACGFPPNQWRPDYDPMLFVVFQGIEF